MQWGTLTIDGGLLFAILWLFGWSLMEFLEDREANNKRLAALGALHAERMRAMELGLPVPDASTYGGEKRDR